MQPLAENTNIPAFLGKLWKMVDDPATDHLISWSQSGNSFIIQNQAQFWYELLPLYYKHNNMSSFVRQLNMYGFHKITTVENGSMDADKDEIQFYHPYFQKDQPEKLVNIKRKGTSAKGQDNQGGGILRNDDLNKCLSDVKQLRGRQASVDSQLSAMKQENAVLWRELALLRQKHKKQQQIVNKLIQFLVTLVQPSASARMGVGVKRRMPLMLHESPNKKIKSSKNIRTSDPGPTIFELDNEIEVSPDHLLEQDVEEMEELPLINSPVTSSTSVSSDRSSKVVNSPLTDDQNVQTEVVNQEGLSTNDMLWDKPEYIDIEGQANQEVNLLNTLSNNTEATEKIFINPNNSNTLISNLINSGSYNLSALGGKNATIGKKSFNTKQINNPLPQPAMQIATKSNQNKIDSNAQCTNNNENFREDLDLHLDNAETELDQLKEILNGVGTFDANALLGLFNENDPEYGIRSTLNNKETPSEEATDPLVSGNELTPANNLIDFTELFDESLENQDNLADSELLSQAVIDSPQATSLDTPLIVKNEPLFPSST